MVANLVVLKMIASFLGPTGMGGLGNLMSLTTMLSVFSGGGIATGITKYVAEYRNSPRRLIRFVCSAFTFGFLFSSIFLLLTFLFPRKISILIFGSSDFLWVIPIIGVAQLGCFFGTAVVSIANGLQRKDVFFFTTLLAYSISIPVSFYLIYNYYLEGAAVALLVILSANFIPAVYFFKRSNSHHLIKLKFFPGDAKNLVRFSVMALVSAVFFPAYEIFIRTKIVDVLGEYDAGLWQALTKLSGAYMGFFTIYLSINYMPKLSALSDRFSISITIQRTIIKIGLLFFLFAVLLLFFKNIVISLLFSTDFLTTSPFVFWLLLGDFFRLLAYVIGFLGVAKAAIRLYVFCEIFQVGLLTCFAYAALGLESGLSSIFKSYALAYFVYFILMIFAFVQYRRGYFDFSR